VSILVVTGLAREARIVAAPHMVVAYGAGHGDGVRQAIAAAIQPHTTGIISMGIAGALAPALISGDVVISTEIVSRGTRLPADPRWADRIAMRLPKVTRGAIAGADAIVASADAKAALHEATGAIAVDTESFPAAEAAAARGLPFAALRVISDAAKDALPPAALVAMRPDGRLALGAILRSLLAQPSQLRDLLRLGNDSERAFRRLLRCRDLLGAGFASPDFG
jgi:hopanoid-associated phosphorylase